MTNSPQNQPKGLPTPVMDASGEILTGADQVRDQIRQATKILSPEFSSELSFIHHITGFGRRVVVPANQIHAVRAAGFNKYARLSTETRFFGIDSADTASDVEGNAVGVAIYWLNDLTEVIVLGTESFTIPIPTIVTRDADQVRLTITAHAMASLDPRAVSKAAKKIGQNAEDLINSIVQVVISALVTQAAHMRVREMIANYTQLSEAARPEITQALTELGYNLDVLKITNIGGEAVRRWEDEAQARVDKTATEETNKAQLAELENNTQRQQREAELTAQERIKQESENRRAAQDIADGEHNLSLLQIERKKVEAAKQNDADQAGVQLRLGVESAETRKAAAISRQQAEQEAELRAYEAQKEDELRQERIEREARFKLAQTEAEAKRLAAEQTERLEREQARAQADAERLEQEETATAERRRQVLQIEAEAEAQSKKIEAEAGAQQIRTEAMAKADAAVQEAEAAKARAAAEKVEAEATRAKTAAEGLAKAEVAARNAEVALAQADADKAAGLAQAEVTEAQARAAAAGEREQKLVEIEAKERLATLYTDNQQLFELEQLRMRFAHELELATVQQQTQIAMIQALAQNMEIKVVGNAGQMGQILSEMMTLQAGVETAAEEFPFLKSLVGGSGRALSNLPGALGAALKDVQPRMFASLTVSDLMERLLAVANGDSDLVDAIQGLRKDSNFRVVGNIPIIELLGKLVAGNEDAEETGTIIQNEAVPHQG